MSNWNTTGIIFERDLNVANEVAPFNNSNYISSCTLCPELPSFSSISSSSISSSTTSSITSSGSSGGGGEGSSSSEISSSSSVSSSSLSSSSESSSESSSIESSSGESSSSEESSIISSEESSGGSSEVSSGGSSGGGESSSSEESSSSSSSSSSDVCYWGVASFGNNGVWNACNSNQAACWNDATMLGQFPKVAPGITYFASGGYSYYYPEGYYINLLECGYDTTGTYHADWPCTCSC